MIPSSRRALAVVCWMMCVRLTVSQDSPPVPKLSFGFSVNESNIQLYTEVTFECVASRAPFPITMFIGRIKSPSQTSANTEPWAISEVIRYSKTIHFTVTAQPLTEGDVVCWYKSTRDEQMSGFSNPVKLVISSLPPPKMTLVPRLFPVDGNYSVNCDSTAGPATNFSMSLYYRTLPVNPNTTLIHLGSLNLTGSNNRIFLKQMKVNIQVEYVCSMEMLYNGKVIHSPLSNFEPAIPEELPIQLWRNGRGGGCVGNVNIKLRDKWKPVCQELITTTSSSAAAATAEVACRELGCGHAVGWQRVVDRSMSSTTTGGVRCSGSEKKIRDCPMDDLQYCGHINTLQIVCSDALPPPKLSVHTYGPVSKLYVTDKQPVKISCSFTSPYLTRDDTTDMLFRHNGRILSDPSTRTNSSSDYTIYDPVPEGEYDCVYQLDQKVRSWPSNAVLIYRYNPPDPVPIVAGVFTTVVGAAIMIYICVFKKAEEIQCNEIPTNSCDPEATNAHTAQPENNVNYLPQQL